MSLKNHQLVSAWFSNSQIAILILACANPETGSARTRATVAARHRTVFLIKHLVKAVIGRSCSGREVLSRCRDRASRARQRDSRSEEHTSELQSLAYLVCRLLLEKK